MVFVCAEFGSVVVLRQRANSMDTFGKFSIFGGGLPLDLRGCQCGAADIVEPAHLRAVGIHVCHQKRYHFTVAQHVVQTRREYTYWVPRTKIQFCHYPTHTVRGCQ